MHFPCLRITFLFPRPGIVESRFDFNKVSFSVSFKVLLIDGLHLTSWWPYLGYNTKEYVINSIVGTSGRG